MFFVIDYLKHRNVKEMHSIILAQATIEGNLYSRGPTTSASSAQPRDGSDECIPCVDGTWPDPDGQR